MILYSYWKILIAAAVIPPAILLFVVYRMDKIEKEPLSLLLGLFFRGVLAMFPILLLELVADKLVETVSWSQMVYLFLAYFVVPGFIEEGIKFRVLERRTWNDPAFNYVFDGVVYAVFVSLGFAAVENVLYVMNSGLATAGVRALFSIPGHAMFGIFMGTGYGRAKFLEARGQREQAAAARKKAYLTAAVLHGLYDFILIAFHGVFYVYFIILVIFAVRTLRRASRWDQPIF